MDIRLQLLKDHSKENTAYITEYIGGDQGRFDELVNIFLNGTPREVQRAAWVLGDTARLHPELVFKQLDDLVANLRQKNIHDAVKRNTLRFLQEIEIPEELWGEVADICFGYLNSNDEAVAIKVFSMSALQQIVLQVPELAHELRIIIEDQLPYASAGFKSRSKKVLAAIAKVERPF